MRSPKYVIYVQTIEGDIIRAFTWVRDPKSGIERAKRDSYLFGHVPVQIWAEPVGG